ncbi:MAG: hypothetical protein Tsb0026_21360 [Sulfuricaulis sp.]
MVAEDISVKSPEETFSRAGSDFRLVEERRTKLAALREAGNAFPNDFRRSDLATDLHRHYADHSSEMLEAEPKTVSVAGRMILKRVMGKASFASIQDMSGRIQLYIANDVAGAEAGPAAPRAEAGGGRRELGGEAGAKAKGAMQVEGKDYIVKDGDVIYFRTSA